MKKAISFILAFTLCLLQCACSSGVKSDDGDYSVLIGLNSEEEGYIVPMLPGKYSTKNIGDKVKWAAVTPDRSSIVFIKDDGTLHTVTVNSSEAKKIADDAAEVICLENTGFVYCAEVPWRETSLRQYYRYTFADGEHVKLGFMVDAEFADDSLSAAYMVIDGLEEMIKDASAYDEEKLKVCVRLLNESSSEPKTLTSASLGEMSYMDVLAISEGADKVIWSESKDGGGSATVYLYANGDKDTLCSIDGSISEVQHNGDLSLMTVTDGTNNVLYASIGGETEKYKFGDTISGMEIYTDKGRISDSTSAVRGLYVSCIGSDGYNLYWVNIDGDREKVAGNLGNYRINNGSILYTDDEGRLYSAKLSGAELTDAEKISGDVEGFYTTEDEKTAIYYKNMGESDAWTLYAYTGRGEPQKISAEAAGKYYPRFYISSDFGSIFYFEDIEQADSGDYYGTLMKYSLRDKESVKISSEVLTDSLFDGMEHNFTYTVDGRCFIYGKYVEDDGSNIVLNWVLSNGKNSMTVAKNLTKAGLYERLAAAGTEFVAAIAAALAE